MQISSFLAGIFLTASTVVASNTSIGQTKQLEKQIRVQYKNISLEKALEQLQQKYEIPLAYSNEANYLKKNINYSANKKAGEVLNDLLRSVGLEYQVKNDYVLFKPRTIEGTKAATVQQDREIVGTVANSAGEIMAGVSVSVKDKPQIGTTTDLNGKFVLTIPQSSSLVFQMVGYRTEEVKIDDQRHINVRLEQTEEGLDEVVVVGFGTQKKISLVGAQSTVSAKDLQVPKANLTNTLAGRIAGVVSVQRNGEPGFDDASIWIRGISTFSEGLSAPLVLVDGTPRKMSNVDPEDIESFTVLKDASATAVYGVQGANGVVIIKTKSGQAGKPRFSFRYYEGITKPTTLPEFADGITYMRMSNEALSNRSAAPIYSEDRIQQTIDGTDPYMYPNVDWMDVLFRDHGTQRRGNLNVSGGSDRVTYYVGANYLDESGLYNDNAESRYNYQVGFKRYSMTSNLHIKASNLAKIDLGIQGYLVNANYPGTGQGTIFSNAWMATPVLHPVKYENGYIADQRSGGLINPYASLTETGYANQWRNQLFSNLRVTHDLPFITQGLSATGMFSFDVYNYTSMRRTKVPDTYLATGRDENGEMQYEQTRVGDRFLSFSRNSEGERTIYVEAALNYNRSFQKHTTSAMLLFNKSDRLNSQASDLITSLANRYMGLSGRLTYNYDNRYFAEANFGYNGSENFAPDNQYGFFPSMGVAWAISEEKFFEPLKSTFSLAKLRFSHGKVGNSNMGGRRFAYISTISTATGYNLGQDRNNSFNGYNIGEYGVNVTWEMSTKSNLGIDLQTKNNELVFQFDLFKERREGIFLRRSNVPTYIGLVNAPWGNLGVIDNQGFDGSLTWSKKIKDFGFQILGNITYNRNEVIENDQPEPLYPWLDQRGKKVNQRFGLVATGLFESQNEIDNGPLHPGTVQPGDIRFQDMNGDGKIDDFDKVAIGYGTIPELVYGLGLSFSYKNWAISTLFQGVGNVDILTNGEGMNPFSVSMSRGNLLSNIEDRWTIDNPRQDVFYPRLSDGSPNGNYQTSTWWLQNGRYLRLKDVQLNYTLPKRMIEPLKLSNAQIFLAGNNVFTWSPFKLWDVELGDGRGTTYPSTSVYSVGVNINF